MGGDWPSGDFGGGVGGVLKYRPLSPPGSNLLSNHLPFASVFFAFLLFFFYLQVDGVAKAVVVEAAIAVAAVAAVLVLCSIFKSKLQRSQLTIWYSRHIRRPD